MQQALAEKLTTLAPSRFVEWTGVSLIHHIKGNSKNTEEMRLRFTNIHILTRTSYVSLQSSWETLQEWIDFNPDGCHTEYEFLGFG